MDNIQSYTTLTGLTVEQVAQKLDAELPKDAYKPVPGAAGLTDIDPNYMRKVLNEIFGICGIGWGYSYEPGDLIVNVEERTTNAGKARRVHVASLKRLRFWYKLNGTVAIHICDVYASGGSDNDVEGYAMSGAITNALGKAVSNLGFQESVYLGKRDHRTVGKRRLEPVEGKATTSKPAGLTGEAVSKPASKAATVSKPVPKTEAKKAEVSDEIIDEPQTISGPIVMDNPDGFIIPTGKRQGQKLGDQTLDVIAWYANTLKPANDEQVKLQAAAKALVKVRSNGHEPVAV